MTTKAKPTSNKAWKELDARMTRPRVERTGAGGVRECRVHHTALGPGWLAYDAMRFVFTADDGRVLDITGWQRWSHSRVPGLLNQRRKRTLEDDDYESMLLHDGSTHEFRLEFVAGKSASENAQHGNERQLMLPL